MNQTYFLCLARLSLTQVMHKHTDIILSILKMTNLNCELFDLLNIKLV